MPGPAITFPIAFAKPLAKSPPKLSPSFDPKASERNPTILLAASRNSFNAGAKVKSPKLAVSSLTLVRVWFAIDANVFWS